MIENKKSLILYILDILKEYSDIDHKLTLEDIRKKISIIYGMEFERKSISINIDMLIDFGYDIIKTRRGSYLNQREFENSEIQFLIDSIFSNKAIDSKHTKELAKKISSFSNKYQRKNYNYIYKCDELVKTDNKSLFYNIDIITEAIENDKQVEFNYERFSLDNEPDTKKHIVSPYYLVSNQGRYYLICNYYFVNQIANCRIDKIKNIKITDKPRRNITTITGFENGFDISKYINERIYMFASGEIKTITLKLYDNHAFEYIDEWFGNNAQYYKRNGENFAKVTVNERALIYWILQYFNHVEVIKPLETREKIKSMVNDLFKKYN